MTKGTLIRTLFMLFILSLLIIGCGESRDFDTAKKENSKESYQAYLDKHPEGKFVDEAKYRMYELDAFSVITKVGQYFESFRSSEDSAPGSVNFIYAQKAMKALAEEGKAFSGKPIPGAVEEFNVVLTEFGPVYRSLWEDYMPGYLNRKAKALTQVDPESSTQEMRMALAKAQEIENEKIEYVNTYVNKWLKDYRPKVMKSLDNLLKTANITLNGKDGKSTDQ